ncbi:YbhB/YbcL family Raf kinase inhibitor-like protein [bacterium]|nr:YbhB/YbcL family Raf kinase inhibitor-like protein [candidate division CSSED10-310 bacterium]
MSFLPGRKAAQSAESDKFTLASGVFAEGGSIPVKYSCDGKDLSPPLSWSEPPDGTKSYVLIMDDPDAPVGTWDHWILYGIPVETRALPEGVAPEETIPSVGTHGLNSWKRIGYGGPCPPSGTHRYFFRLYALDTDPGLPARQSKSQVETAIKNHILAQTTLMGRYSRK